MNLLGVDVGYSKTRSTTGVAWRVAGEVGAIKTGTHWNERKRSLPPGVTFALVALDAPLLPDHEGMPRRGCEQFFYGGRFWNRCRPGLSHHGRSQSLRPAGKEAAAAFAQVLDESCCVLTDLVVRPNVPIIEAFPNTFLGVLLPEGAFETNKLKNEKRSDWLYEKALQTQQIQKALKFLGWSDARTITRFEQEEDHDCRAALVCLLTAAFAAAGTATVVGDADHGWFWLPPRDIWDQWALAEVDTCLSRLRAGGFTLTVIRCTHLDKTNAQDCRWCHAVV